MQSEEEIAKNRHHQQCRVMVKNKKSISLFEVANSEYYIELEKDKWKSSLENALEYYLEREEYNKCAECRDLINQL